MPARKLCQQCVLEGPWRYDDNGNSLGKCETCFPPTGQQTVSPELARDAGMRAAADANPAAMNDALRIIRATAETREVFSSNDCREQMDLAQIPGPVRGMAWRRAASNRWIKRAGSVPSTDVGTHAHEVKLWQSLIVRRAAV